MSRAQSRGNPRRGRSGVTLSLDAPDDTLRTCAREETTLSALSHSVAVGQRREPWRGASCAEQLLKPHSP